MAEQYFGPGKEMNGWEWKDWLAFEERLDGLSDEQLSMVCEKYGVTFEPGDTPREHINGALLEATQKGMLMHDVEEMEK
jgi:hypothetical protein